MNFILLKILKRKKKPLLIYISIISFVLLILNIFLNLFINTSDKISNEIFQKESNRKLYVEIKQNENSKIHLKQLISNIDENAELIDYFFPILVTNSDYGIIKINRLIGKEKSIIKGRFPKTNEMEIIIPERLKINGKTTKSEYLLNKKIELDLQDNNTIKTTEFLVVGIYENKSASTVSEFYTLKNIPSINKNIEKYIILLGDATKTNKVIKYLKTNEIVSEIFDKSTRDEFVIYNGLLNVITIFIFIILILSLLFLSFITKDIINNQKENIAIMKVYGYKFKHILCNLLGCLSFIINVSTLLIITISPTINIIMNKLNLSIIRMDFNVYIFTYVFINILFFAIALAYCKNINKISIIQIISKY